MVEPRRLGIQDYITELLQNGVINDPLYIGKELQLRTLSVVERFDLFFIAKQLPFEIGLPKADGITPCRFKLVYFPQNIWG